MKFPVSILWLFCLTVFAGDSATVQPNVLLIVSADNGPELGCYGDLYARTPNLDKLAGEAVLFERAIVPQAGRSQSRASFLTELYPHQHARWRTQLFAEYPF